MIPKVEGKNLKKKFGFIIVLIIVVLVGCGDNNFPKAEYGNYNRVRSAAETALLESRITEPGEFSRLTAEIAYTVERDREYQVEFLYEAESGRVVTISDIRWRQNYINEKEYRELLRADLTANVLRSLNDHSLSSGRTVGVILKWSKRDFWGNVVAAYALCDLNGDGAWDYLTFNEKPFRVLEASFAETFDDKYPKREVNKFCTISFMSDSEIKKLQDLSGQERIGYFEEMA